MSMASRSRRRFVLACVAATVLLGLSLGFPRDLGSVPASPATTALPIRAAFYYPWYPEAWHPGDHDQPSVGQYESVNRTVVAHHVAAMKYAGLDAAIVPWSGVGSLSGRRFSMLLEVAEAQGLFLAPS